MARLYKKLNPIEEMRNMLGTSKRMTLESFILPEEEDKSNKEDRIEKDVDSDVLDRSSDEEDVKKAIIQIRKIAIGIIAKLSETPTSNSYTFMKRILDMSDKAMENLHSENKND